MSIAAAVALRAVVREVAARHGWSAAAAPLVWLDGATTPPKAPLPRLEPSRGQATLSDANDNQSDAIVMTEAVAPFKVTHVNKAWCDMCGYESEEAEGKTNAILQGPETDMAAVRRMVTKCVEQREPASATVINCKKGGGPVASSTRHGSARIPATRTACCHMWHGDGVDWAGTSRMWSGMPVARVPGPNRCRSSLSTTRTTCCGSSWPPCTRSTSHGGSWSRWSRSTHSIPGRDALSTWPAQGMIDRACQESAAGGWKLR
jgi:PAS domain S-box-containing protein